ncbi:MAG: hypothetical protein PF904_11935 [Kiritimatiellae bacterium]|jgi:hypothetical protein|nr:hypothetical protein [Kiritimatiellia bacterium]
MQLKHLTFTLSLVVLLGCLSCEHFTEKKLTSKNLKAARRELAWKKRRVLMNNDGNDSRKALKKTREAFLESRSTPLIGSQVDTILYCDGIWGMFTHASPTADLRAGSDQAYKEWAVDLIKDGGPDPLGSVIDFGHTNGIEVFWSLRMSDTHDSGDPTMLSPWKKENPDCLVGKFEERKSYKGAGKRWSGVNYAEKKVRDRTVGWFDEVGAKYDVDGFELDFFRHLVFFKNPLLGKPATDENRKQMTEVIRSIRKIADKHALRRGHPILVTVRVPDSLEYGKDAGLDIEEWLKEGLIDMMTVSGYFRLNSWKTSVELGHQYDVPVFAGLSESRVRKPKRKFKNKPEEYRGRAFSAWNEGVDGVYTFNHFNPKSPVFSEIGDPVALAGMDKVYTTGARNTRAVNYWLADGMQYMGRFVPLADTPRKLSNTEPLIVPVDIWDNFADASSQMRARATFVLSGVKEPSQLEVKLNDHSLKLEKMKMGRVSCNLSSHQIKAGENSFSFRVTDASLPKAALLDLVVKVEVTK